MSLHVPSASWTHRWALQGGALSEAALLAKGSTVCKWHSPLKQTQLQDLNPGQD